MTYRHLNKDLVIQFELKVTFNISMCINVNLSYMVKGQVLISRVRDLKTHPNC